MNLKRVVLAGVAAFAVTTAIGLVANSVFISDLFIQHVSAAAVRPLADRLSRLPYVFLVGLLGKVAFAYVYANVYANRPGVIQGIKLGLAVAVMVSLSGLIGSWMLFPIGGLWPLLMAPFEFAMWVVSGAVVAMLYKPKQIVQPAAAATVV